MCQNLINYNNQISKFTMKKILLLMTMVLTCVGTWAQPKVSGAPIDGKWAVNTTWYMMKNGKGYYINKKYCDGSGYLMLNDKTKSYDDVALWCIVGDEANGYKFYNRAAGPDRVLALTGSDQNARVNFVDASTSNETTNFFFATSTKSGGYWCVRTDKSGNNYWNARNNYLALWNSASATQNDDGSAIFFEEVLIDGDAYTFTNIRHNASGQNVALYMDDNGLQIGTKSASDYGTKAIFIARRVGDKYVFVNGATGKYLTWKGTGANTSGSGLNSNKGYVSSYETACLFNLAPDEERQNTLTFGISQRPNDNREANIIITYNNDGTYSFNQNADQNPYNTGAHSSYFRFEKVEYSNQPNMNPISGTMITGEEFEGKNITTFSSPFPTVLPEDVSAYYIQSGNLNSDYAKLTKLDTQALPANEGFILVGTQSGLKAITMLPRTTETIASLSGNLLGHSAGADKAYVATEHNYILSGQNVDGIMQVGFYWWNTGSLAMNKAYLKGGNASQTNIMKIVWEGDVTDIEENIVAPTLNTMAPIYDLSGRRVQNTTKGGIYIQNGKKFIVK